MHSKNLIHRDIKPSNIALTYSSSGSGEIFLIDFGLAKKISKPTEEGQAKKRKVFEGTAYFSSINALRCYGKFVYKFVLLRWPYSFSLPEQSRRDDIESLAYVLLYFLRQGCMPWNCLALLPAGTRPSKVFLALLAQRKQNVCNNISDLEVPSIYQEFLDHARSLAYSDIPDYNRFKQAFRQLAELEEIRESTVI